MTVDHVRPILVVDDDEKIVRLVRIYLERERYQVIGALDGRTALRSIESDNPALVVLDVMLPELDGLGVLRAIRDRGDLPVILLSARGTPTDRIAGLGHGADDYVTKPFSPAELVLRVGRVLARSVAAQPSEPALPLEHNGLVADPGRHSVTVDGSNVALTAVELRILVAIVEAEGRVLTRARLLDAVHGNDATDVLDRTIDVHVGRLRDKLGDSAANPRFIATVRGVGYRAAPRSNGGAPTQ